MTTMGELLEKLSDEALKKLWYSTNEAVRELQGDTPLTDCELLGSEHFCNLLQLSIVAFEVWRSREKKKMENQNK